MFAKSKLVAVLMVLAVVATAIAEDKSTVVPIVQAKPKPMTTIEVEARLAAIPMTVDYNDTPFEEVIADIRGEVGINVIAYWPALEAVNVYRDNTVTMQLTEVSAFKVLEAALDYISGSAIVPLAWRVDRGVLEINTVNRYPDRRSLRVYYIADLLSMRSSYNNSTLDGSSGSSSSGGGGRTGGNRPGGSGRSSGKTNRSR